MSVGRHSLTLKIGNKTVGENQPCFVVAEIGSNHNQDFDLARRLIDAAATTGVDAVKFQTFRADEHYSKRTPSFNYLKGADTHTLIRSLEIDRSWQASLKQHAEARDLSFFSSPCDYDAVAGLHELDVPAYKVASFDLTDIDLVTVIANVGKPIILSTGMADWLDIQRAVDACRHANNSEIVLLQCTSLYPAPANLSNLRAMESMRVAFKTLVGYSDHTIGDHVPLAAVALGACMLEKHFTLDRGLPGPDHAFSIEPKELGEMMRKLREIEAGMGDGVKNGPQSEESEMAAKGRRSLHARCAITCGEMITADMLVVKRPGFGILPASKSLVVGRIARRDIEADQWITWDMI
jgi:sialic acid synthase SpsE